MLPLFDASEVERLIQEVKHLGLQLIAINARAIERWRRRERLQGQDDGDAALLADRACDRHGGARHPSTKGSDTNTRYDARKLSRGINSSLRLGMC